MRAASFDPLGPLPEPGSTTVLEASAGTGKTHAIAGLAVRFIAEQAIDPAQLLLVTFGRNATRELRDRVRSSMVRARDALLDPTHPARVTDDTVAHLVSSGDSRAAARLAGAVAGFDSMTIATTHQFAGRSLRGLGLLGDSDSGEAMLADHRELLTEVLDDLYVRKYASRQIEEGERQLTYRAAATIANEAVGDPQAHIYGLDKLLAGQPVGSATAATRVRLADALRREAARRRRVGRLVTYDDLISRLTEVLADPVVGLPACARLAGQYRVVMVDEFQDTDPLQWQIVSRAFHGRSALILIGDPKQAIYAFRGADVHSYLVARSVSQRQETLATNHRSDAPVVAGVGELLGNVELGDPRIAVGPITAAERHIETRIRAGGPSGLDGPQRVRLRVLARPGDATAPVAKCRSEVLTDLVGHITRLLGAARLGPIGSERALAPGDVAVLVGTNTQAELVRNGLVEAGVAAVVNGTTSVFSTPAARMWLDLLRALDRPRPMLVRAVAIGDLLGHTAQDLGNTGDAIAEEVSLQLRRWSHTLQAGSVAAMQAQMDAETRFTARLLEATDGERVVTDLRHIGALLHRHSKRTGAGAPGLAAWLSDAIREANGAAREGSAELTLRLDTDEQAVQVLTVHRAKGMQFPVAYLPFAWDRYVAKDLPEVLRCHDADGQRIIDVRGPVPGRGELVRAYEAEEAGESLRTLYVGLTRASSLVVVHWAGSSQNTSASPLHRLLCARAEGAVQPQPSYPVRAAPTKWLADSSLVAVEPVVAQAPLRLTASPQTGTAGLRAATYDRVVDTTWRRTSFTALTSDSHDGRAPGGEIAPAGLRTDEPEELQEPSGGTPDPTAGSSGFMDLPGGTSFGTLVHSVLQELQTGGPDLAASVALACQAGMAAHPVAGVDVAELAPAIVAAVNTPLGPLAQGLALAQIPSSQRLAELDFELPLGQGPAGPADVKAIAKLLERHLGSDDPLAEYAGHLAGITQPLNGYLAGSIDAVLRVGDVPNGQRFLVVDYKTNRLHGSQPGRLPGLQAYRPDRLPAAMIASHYPLQALLYSAALHRYLRWRQPDYQPEKHLGGVLYLFLRGMSGPGTPTEDGTPFGVFSWSPPPGLVVELSDLLAGGLS